MYYKCSKNKKYSACKKKALRKQEIEDLVVHHIKAMLLDDSILERLADMILDIQARENTTIPFIKKQLAETEKAITNIVKAIEQGVYSSATKARLDELEAQKSDLEIGLLKEEMTTEKLSREQIMFFLLRFRSIDTTNEKQRQKLVDGFLNSVYVYDDHLVLAVNFKEHTTTVTFEHVSGSDTVRYAPPKPLKMLNFQGLFDSMLQR